MSAGSPPAAPGAPLALAVLVAIVVFSPWPFGSVGALASAVLLACALGTACVVLAYASWRGGLALPAVPLWPLVGFVGLGLGQLVPWPPLLHDWLAPGSFAVWHPAEPAAAAVLGPGAHPVSIAPLATLAAVAQLAGLGLLAVAAAPGLARAGTAKRALAVVAAGGLGLAAYAIWARARFGTLLFGRLAVPTVSPFGPFVNKNHFAGWSALAALLAAGLALGLVEEGRRHERDWTTSGRAAGVVLALSCALAMALAVLASLSRGGTAALATGAACLVLLALGRPRVARRRLLVPGLTAALALAASVVILAPPSARSRLESLAGAGFRFATWHDALRLVPGGPLFGQGLGAFQDAFPGVKRANGTFRAEHAENDYLESLAETGGVGLALALCGLVALLRAGARPAAGAAGVSRGVAYGATAALVALAVHSLLDFDLRIPSNAALAALAASAAASGAGVRRERLGRAASGALSLAAGGLLVAALELPPPSLSRAREEARRAWSAPSPVARALQLARLEPTLVLELRWRPADAEGWLLLAGIRAARHEPDARVLAGHAVELDPRRPELRAAADALARAADSP